MQPYRNKKLCSILEYINLQMFQYCFALRLFHQQ